MAGSTSIPHAFTSRLAWSGYLIGFAFGGFLDGILLHQILQWHHLLSGLDAPGLRDLRIQILADGLFHALMYALGAAGLWLLYRSRAELTGASADRILVADMLIGFGAWHVIDALASHWLTGIHRIRMDVPDPLLWDLGWLALFGLPPLIAGLWLKRRYPREAHIEDRRRRSGQGVAIGLAALTLLAGGWAALPPSGRQGPETVAVLLRPDVRPGEFLSALRQSDARVLWSDAVGGTWVLTRHPDASFVDYYRHGALYVSGSLLPAGCASWIGTTSPSPR